MNQSADSLYRQAGERFAPSIARLARAVERDAEKARDLEQEMHCALWTSLHRFKGECALKTWVYRVAHNVAADHVAAARRGPAKVSLEDIDALPAVASHDGRSVETGAAEALVLAQVRALIAALPALDAQVILLWLEGESGADIAEITGLSVGAANVRVHRIKALLADHFRAPPTEGDDR